MIKTIRKTFFDVLDVYHDASSRSAAMNMAIDEALLERSIRPSIRFYRWDHSALSFGYFGKYADVETYADHRDIVRRWTGGGIVLHGNDLTYSVIISARESVFAESSTSIYECIHGALCKALVREGIRAELAPAAAVHLSRRSGANADDRRERVTSAQPSEAWAVADCRYSKHACFANPVRADVLIDDQKVAGAAQRRTRIGLLQQGSVQHIDLPKDFEVRFAGELSLDCTEARIENDILDRAREISQRKYSLEAWLRKR